MFQRPTVFILGAGASVDYKYPTGAELVTRVVKKAHQVGEFCHSSSGAGHMSNLNSQMPLFIAPTPLNDVRSSQLMKLWRQAQEDCNVLWRKIDAINPPVIDHFLHENPGLAELGRLMIALVILECEGLHRRQIDDEDEPTKRSDWYKFLRAELARDCQSPDQLKDNEVCFVTFNYDVSLEYELFTRLMATESTADSSAIRHFLDTKVVHIYGQMRRGVPTLTEVDAAIIGNTSAGPGMEEYRRKIKEVLDEAYVAANHFAHREDL